MCEYTFYENHKYILVYASDWYSNCSLKLTTSKEWNIVNEKDFLSFEANWDSKKILYSQRVSSLASKSSLAVVFPRDSSPILFTQGNSLRHPIMGRKPSSSGVLHWEQGSSWLNKAFYGLLSSLNIAFKHALINLILLKEMFGAASKFSSLSILKTFSPN